MPHGLSVVFFPANRRDQKFALRILVWILAEIVINALICVNFRTENSPLRDL